LLRHIDHAGNVRDGESRADLHGAVHEIALVER
jgi:hypothetical protein